MITRIEGRNGFLSLKNSRGICKHDLRVQKTRTYTCTKYSTHSFAHTGTLTHANTHTHIHTHTNSLSHTLTQIFYLSLSPTTGSRSGGLIAQTWASLVSVGEDGFMKHTKEIMETTIFIKNEVAKIPGLKLLGSCEAMIVCFTGDVPTKDGTLRLLSIEYEKVIQGYEFIIQKILQSFYLSVFHAHIHPLPTFPPSLCLSHVLLLLTHSHTLTLPSYSHCLLYPMHVSLTHSLPLLLSLTPTPGTKQKPINVYTVADNMAKKGWSLNPLQNPPCVHICCTLRHVGREQVRI